MTASVAAAQPSSSPHRVPGVTYPAAASKKTSERRSGNSLYSSPVFVCEAAFDRHEAV